MKNEQDIVVRNKGGLKTKFETKYRSLSSYVFYFLPLLLRFKKNYSSMFYASNDIENVQFGVEMKENLKVSSDRISFVLYPSCNLIAT
jgi:hypothetical protein